MNRLEIELNRKELEKSANANLLSQQALYNQAEQMHLTAKISAMSTIIIIHKLITLALHQI